MRKGKKLRKLIKAAQRGNRPAMYRLGLCYDRGDRLPKDPQTAYTWIAAAAMLGYSPAVAWVEDDGFDDDALTQAFA